MEPRESQKQKTKMIKSNPSVQGNSALHTSKEPISAKGTIFASTQNAVFPI